MKTIAAILLAALAAHLVGSLVLFSVLTGPVAALFTPALAIFGWFFLVPEVIASSLQWLAYRPTSRRSSFLFLLISALIAAPAVALLAPKETGNELHWTLAYALAAAAAAVVSGLVVQTAKRPPTGRSASSITRN